MKFAKNYLESIANVEVYPIISLILFFMIFVVMIMYVSNIPQKTIDQIKNLPLEED